MIIIAYGAASNDAEIFSIAQQSNLCLAILWRALKSLFGGSVALDSLD